ncbi:MAG: amino acid-binding protein [Deltaproteobacteria bacterium]
MDNYKVEQIAIFMKNGYDRLAEVTNLLAENGINIRALSLADTAAYAILRLIVNDAEKTKQVLDESGFTVGGNDVLVIEVPDRPGGTASVLQTIKEQGLHIEYMYAFAQGNGESALIIFRITNPEEAIAALTKAGLRLLTREDVYAL